MAIQAKSSRLCVKNLPAYLDEKKLKATFSRMGEVTDVKIMKTKEGKSRKFGFVGFKDEEMAKKAKDYFDRSFIDTSRVVVEYAIPVGQGALGKPKSKHSNVVEDEQKFQVIENVQEKESKSQENTEKSQDMTEFLSIMQPRSSKAAEKFWSNDDAIASKNASANQIVSKNEKSAAEKLMFDDDDSGDDEDVNDMSGPLKTLSEDEDDKEFAARFGKQSEIKNSAIQEDESSDDDDLNEELTEKENKDSSDNDVDVSETGRLFVRNLPFTVCEEDLMNLFSPFGDISEIHVPLDDLKRPKGFAFVHYSFPEHAVLAMAELDSKNFQGRLLHIIPAKSGKPRSDSESILHAGSEYKQKKLEKLRSQSGREDIWNTLFVNSDTVVAAMAEKYGVSKSDIINPHSEESKVTPAVRVALAETQVISDTKTFLSENGICVDSFRDKPKERSKTVMLVKNLPTNSEESDLRRLFGRFGELGRLVLPPSRTVAVVEFLEPSDARKAFSGLAYKKFKDTPLYLEWAPISIFSKPADSSYLKKSISSETQSLKINPVDEFAEVSEENPVKGSTLFVKNCNFICFAFFCFGPL